MWIKAKNIVGTSGFSLAANAKPSAFAVLPETPVLPTVTPGSRALSVSWTPVEGALSYEVWTGTTNNPASAQKNGADVSSASVTLTGLTNETTYDIWIKAKNNIGASELSPRASGTPSAFAAIPPAPLVAPSVIAGSGQLTVSC
ncbi:fibronectin type III domain-containing protein, partial [Treponema sp. R80B11-R83G3]